MHPHYPLSRLLIPDHLRSFDDAARAQISPITPDRQQLVDKGPLHEVRRGVAVDGLEGRAELFVLADQVVK